MAKKGRPPAPAKFKVGDRVRVKRGIRDTDYPDMPLGGWAGTISDRLVAVATITGKSFPTYNE